MTQFRGVVFFVIYHPFSDNNFFKLRLYLVLNFPIPLSIGFLRQRFAKDMTYYQAALTLLIVNHYPIISTYQHPTVSSWFLNTKVFS